MTGFYSMGLCGYEVTITEDDAREDKIHWAFVGTEKEQRTHRVNLYFTNTGRMYFLANKRRIYLDECMRAD